VRHE
jgi:hypothetical protein